MFWFEVISFIMAKPIDITGQKFHQLTALKLVGFHDNPNGKKDAIWLFRCDCGNEIEVRAKLVKDRVSKKSCGCHVRRGPTQVAYTIWYAHYHDGDLPFERFMALCSSPCTWCGSPPATTRTIKKNSWTYNGLDRLDNNEPHNEDNCVPCCAPCNYLRNKRTVPEFLTQVQAIYLHSLNH